MTLKPTEHLGGLGIYLNLDATAILGTLTSGIAEQLAELGELVAVHDICLGEIGYHIGEAGACGLGDELGDNVALVLALAELGGHEARFAGLNGHMELGDVAALVICDVVVLADLVGERICKCLLGMLSVILIGALDGGHCDSSHVVFLSFLGVFPFTVYIIAHPNGKCNRQIAQSFQKVFVYLAQKCEPERYFNGVASGHVTVSCGHGIGRTGHVTAFTIC